MEFLTSTMKSGNRPCLVTAGDTKAVKWFLQRTPHAPGLGAALSLPSVLSAPCLTVFS